MPPKRKKKAASSQGYNKRNKAAVVTSRQQQHVVPSDPSSDKPASAGYLVTCDVPTKQYILYLNQLKKDKKFILQDLDETHVLIDKRAHAEVEAAVNSFFDANVYSPVEKLGEEFDMS